MLGIHHDYELVRKDELAALREDKEMLEWMACYQVIVTPILRPEGDGINWYCYRHDHRNKHKLCGFSRNSWREAVKEAMKGDMK